MLRTNKGVELTLNTIVMAILVIVVLVVLLAVFSQLFGSQIEILLDFIKEKLGG